MLGGNVKFLSSGAAPLTPEVHEILKICFSCEVVQGVSCRLIIGLVTSADTYSTA